MENNQNETKDSFQSKEGADSSSIGKLKLAGEKAERGKKAFKIFMKLSPKAKIAILALTLLVVIIIIILFGGFLYLLDILGFEDSISAKANIMGSGTSYTNNLVKISSDDRTWNMEVTDELKRQLLDSGKTEEEIENMTQNEMITELFILNGLDRETFSDEEIELVPYLIKAELATQQLDLRESNNMFDSNGDYILPKFDAESSEIQGTVHIKRVSSNNNTPDTILSFIDYETFKSYGANNDSTNGKNYFSCNDDGNIVVYTWSHSKTTYQYDGSVPKDMEMQGTDNYYLQETVIDYKPLIYKYTLPFEATIALLITTEDVEFTKQVADLAFNSYIEIGLMEEYEEVTSTSTSKYEITTRGYQYLNRTITVGGAIAVSKSDELISVENEGSVEDVDCEHDGKHGKEFTYKNENFSNDNPTYTITETTETETNNYKYGVLNADVWFLKLQKNFEKKQTAPSTNSNSGDVEGKYVYNNEQVVSGKDAYNNIKDDNTKKDIQNKIKTVNDSQMPTIKLNGASATVSCKLNISKIVVTRKVNEAQTTETLLPNSTSATINNYAECEKLVILVSNGTQYEIKGNAISGSSTVNYNGFTLTTTEYTKTDIHTEMTTNTNKFEFEEGTSTSDLYDAPGEKFIKALEDNSTASGNINSVFSWLEEMLDEYDSNYTTIIGYLVDKYNGIDSEFDIQSVLDLYGQEGFRSFYNGTTGGIDQFKRWLRTKENEENKWISEDGTKYIVYLVGENRTVGYGIDLDTSGLEVEIAIASGKGADYHFQAGEYIDVEIVDAAENKVIDNAIKGVEADTIGLELTDYQKYALVSRIYNCGKNGAMGFGQYAKNGRTFVEAYNEFWNQERDDEYGAAVSDTIYTHDLYTQYMSLPSTGSGFNLKTRRESEWKLFKLGYYDTLNEYCSLANRYSIDNLNLYNSDGSVNKAEIDKLNSILTQEVLYKSGAYMNGEINLTYLQCTWWAAVRASQYLGEVYPAQNTGAYGNGKEWYNKNLNNGWFEYGSEPRANSLVCWNNKSANGYGHVAYVEAVDTVNKKIYISHASNGAKWNGIKELDWNGYFDGANPIGYIYLDSSKK